jgi:hypothetical protein
MKNNKIEIEVMIPTYKREFECVNRVLEIRKYSDDRFFIKIKILNNDPDGEILDGCFRAKAIIGDENLIVVKNKYNLGAVPNIIKCVAESDLKYVWILGDDDPIVPSAFENLYMALSREVTVAAYYFERVGDPNNGPVSVDYKTVGTPDELIQSRVAIGDLIFMSTTIWLGEYVRSRIWHMYRYMNTHAPVVSALLWDLGNPCGPVCVGLSISSGQIVVKNRPKDARDHYSILPIAMGIGSLLNGGIHFNNYSAIKRLLGEESGRWLSPAKVYLSSVSLGATCDWSICSEQYTNISLSLYFATGSYLEFFVACALRIFMAFGYRANIACVKACLRLLSVRSGVLESGQNIGARFS